MQDLLISTSRVLNYATEEQYIENIKLAQSFYPTLNYFEIALRNKVNHFYLKELGDEWLMNMERNIIFDRTVREKINICKLRICSQNKDITNDNLVANLSLGFWVELFNPKYLLSTSFYKAKINFVFGVSVKNIHKKYLIKLHNELNTIRDFRNRVFHYEKIIEHPKYTYISTQLNNILYRLDSKCYIGNSLKQFNIALLPPSRL